MTSAACGLLACAGCGGSGSSTPVAPKVKLVNELGGSIAEINIMLGDQALPFAQDGGQSQYVDAPAGLQNVTGYVYYPGLENFPATSVNLAAGSKYTLVAIGNPTVSTGGTIPIKIILANDDHANPTSGNALIRYVSCAWNDPPYSVWVNGTSVLNDVYFGEVTGYSEQQAGQISIESVLGDSPPYSVFTFPQTFTLTVGHAYTFYYGNGFSLLEDS